MNTPRKNRTALRPSVVESKLEDRLAMSVGASPFGLQRSFVIPHAMISVAPLPDVHIPVIMDFGTPTQVVPKPAVSIPPLANVNVPVIWNFSMSFGGFTGSSTPGHYNPFNPNDRTGFGPTHSH